MSRFKVLKANPRRTLAALATMLVAVGVTGASGASFNASTANPTNSFSAGTLSMSNSKDNVAILGATDMKPGDPATTGEVTITNTGSLAGTFTLSRSDLAEAVPADPIAGLLNVVVTDCGPDSDCASSGAGSADNVNRYTGTLAAMGTNIALSSFAPSAARTYEFSVQLDASATNAVQGSGATAEFTWDAA